jgi:ATP-binding cassette subfamily A (ABC1) protein 3
VYEVSSVRDEADLLGDRIAIMAEGRLVCCGSSLFLKSRYGVGYRMVIVKAPSCDTAKVCELVLGSVPGSQVVTDVGAELSFVLPSSATHHFPPLFDTLEVEKEGLGVSGYGISVTTMEEVFMRVREGAEMALSHRLALIHSYYIHVTM